MKVRKLEATINNKVRAIEQILVIFVIDPV